LNAAPTQNQISPARALLNAGIAALAFVLVCAILNAALPFPEVEIVSPKLRAFTRHKDDFDTVFIGSSHIHHQLSPTIFDQVMRKNGQVTHSFNFGVDAMHLPESGYALERLLKTKPRNLKWVFIELDEMQVGRFQEQSGTRRALYWHDWKRTSLVLRKILATGRYGKWIASPKKVRDLLIPRKGREQTQELFLFHARLFTKNFTNVGRKIDASRWVSHSENEESPTKDLGPAGDGYFPAKSQMSAKDATAYEAGLERAMAEDKPKFVSPYTEEACRQCAEVIREVGAVPVFLVTPITQQSEFRFRGNPDTPGAVMSFNNAKTYSSLYRTSVRAEATHLNIVGAEEFTSVVAENFARLLQENRIK
jgi:hypothetical protein